jgi:hypothetical protein
VSKKSAIPQFHSIEEEALFWDMHDTTEFEDEFEQVQVKFARPLIKRCVGREQIVVQLEGEPLRTLQGLARSRRVGADVLVRKWILEKLRQAKRSDLHKTA